MITKLKYYWFELTDVNSNFHLTTIISVIFCDPFLMLFVQLIIDEKNVIE